MSLSVTLSDETGNGKKKSLKTPQIQPFQTISATLNMFYMEGLRDALNKSLYGCIAGDRVVRHLMYANDHYFLPICKMVKVCEHYGTKYIKYNSKKSAVVICRNSYVKNVAFSPFTIKRQRY